MNFNHRYLNRSISAIAASVLLSTATYAIEPKQPANTTQDTAQTTVVEFGPYKVNVPKGGYYDRFRMNPDLDEVAKDPAAGNIDYFRTIPKKLVETRVG